MTTTKTHLKLTHRPAEPGDIERWQEYRHTFSHYHLDIQPLLVRLPGTLDTVMEKLAQHDISSLAVMNDKNPTKPVGLLTRADVLARYHEVIEEV